MAVAELDGGGKPADAAEEVALGRAGGAHGDDGLPAQLVDGDGAGRCDLEGDGEDAKEEDLDGDAGGVPEGPANAVLPCDVEALEEGGGPGPLGDDVAKAAAPV